MGIEYMKKDLIYSEVSEELTEELLEQISEYVSQYLIEVKLKRLVDDEHFIDEDSNDLEMKLYEYNY